MTTETQKPIVPPPEYAVGDRVMYRGDAENVWTITGMRQGESGHWWVYAEQHGTRQNFPAGVFTKVEAKKAKAPAQSAPEAEPEQKKKRKVSVGDPVASLLAEAADIQGCWKIAEMAGLDLEELRTKIGHLSNGLQRMGIGNRLRKRWKDGEFDPESIVCTGTGQASDFMFKGDCPDFQEDQQ